jgi:hypothetical protein
MKLKRLIAFAALFLMLTAVVPATAQCPLCKNSVESTLKNNPGGRKTGTGLNAGIMVLFFLPYTAAMVVGVLWYSNTRKKKNIRRLHE